MTYFNSRLSAMQLEPSDYTANCSVVWENTEYPDFKNKPLPLLQSDADGNIDMFPTTIDGRLYTYTTESDRKNNMVGVKEQIYCITRLAPENAKNNDRFRFPANSGIGSLPFFPPNLITSFQQATARRSDTLIITEGYLKAIVGAKMGLDIVGLSSISHYRDGINNTNLIHHDIVRLIKQQKYKRIVLLYDADAVSVKKYLDPEDTSIDNVDMATRLQHFSSAVIKCYEALKGVVRGIKIEFAQIHPKYNDTSHKGLDDLLLSDAVTADVVDELLGISSTIQYFQFIELSNNGYSFNIQKHFCLFGIDDFFRRFKAIIPKGKLFNFKGIVAYHKPEGGYDIIDEEDDKDQRRALGIPPDAQANLKVYYRYGFYTYGGYWFITKKKHRWVSDFEIRCKYLIPEKKRLVTIRNADGLELNLSLTIEETNVAGKFRNRIKGISNLNWRGSDADLVSIMAYVQREEKVAHEVSKLGMNDDMYFFANGVVDTNKGQLLPYREGIIEVQDKNYYVPIAELGDGKVYSLFENFVCEKGSISIADYAQQVSIVHGDNGLLGLVWAMAGFHRDIIFGHLRAFPHLFFVGPTGGGKSLLASHINALYGKVDAMPTSLDGKTTVAGIARKIQELNNGLSRLEEYKNNSRYVHEIVAMLKDAYQGGGRVHADKTTERTSERRVDSAILICGQQMPSYDPAFGNRMLLCKFGEGKFTADAVKSASSLTRQIQEGLGHIAIEVLKLRSIFKSDYKKEFDSVMATWRNHAENVKERYIENYVAICAAAKILTENLTLGFDYAKFERIMLENFTQQIASLQSTNELQEFWDSICDMLRRRLVTNGIDVQIVPEGYILLRLKLVLPAYVEYYRKKYGESPMGGSLTTLKMYMRNCPAYSEAESSKKQHYFMLLKSQTSAMAFSLDALKMQYDIVPADYLPVTEDAVPIEVEELPF